MDEERFRQTLESFDIMDESIIQRIRAFVINRDFQGFLASKIVGRGMTNTIWKAIEQIRDILYLRYTVEEGPYKQVTGVIMGACGNGKTALMNNICVTVHGTGEQMESKTRNIVCEYVQYVPQNSFRVYDTPGTNAQVEVPKHASLLRASLTHKPVNVIFISLKYQRRGFELVKNMEDEMDKVSNYSEKVVFLVSHADIAQELQKMMTETYEEMSRINMPQQVVFYSNTRCSKKRLAQTLFTIGTNYPSVQIDIPEAEFLKKFRIGCIDSKFRKEFESSLTEMEQLTEVYIKCAVELTQNEEKEQIIQELALDLKYSLQEMLQEFTQRARDKMLQHDYYGVYFALQKLILDADEKFHLNTRHFLQYSLIHNPNSSGEGAQSILDLLKQCPSCSQIWLRVEACPNTTCGSRPSNYWDCSVGRAYFKYHVQKAGNHLKVERKQQINEAVPTTNSNSHIETANFHVAGKWNLKKRDQEIRRKLQTLAAEEEQFEEELAASSSETWKDAVSVQRCANRVYLESLLGNLRQLINDGRRIMLETWEKLGQSTDSTLSDSAGSQYIQSVNRQRYIVQQELEGLYLQQEYRKQLKEMRSHLINMIEECQHLEQEAARSKGHAFTDLWRQAGIRKTNIQDAKNQLYKLLMRKANKIGLFIKLQSMATQAYELERKLERCSIPEKGSILSQFGEIQTSLKELQAERDSTITSVLEKEPDLAEIEGKFGVLANKLLNLSTNMWRQFHQYAPEILKQSDRLKSLALNQTVRSQHRKVLVSCLSVVKQGISVLRRELQLVQSEIVRNNSKGWVGCGYPMDFRTLPRIPNVLEMLKDLYTTSDLNQIQAKLVADREVIAERKRIEEFVQRNLEQCEKHFEKKE